MIFHLSHMTFKFTPFSDSLLGSILPSCDHWYVFFHFWNKNWRPKGLLKYQGSRWHQDTSYQLKFSLAKMWYAVAILVDMRVVYTFNMSDHTKYMWLGGRRHRRRHGQLGGEDQEIRWHEDVSYQLKFSLSRMWYAEVMVIDMKVFILSIYLTTH